MAHFDRYVPYFHHNLSKMSIPLKLGVPACSEVILSRFGASQKAVFQPVFWRKSSFWLISTKWRPPLHLHRWKAMDLSFLTVLPNPRFNHPTSRQNFVNASGMVCAHKLTVCNKTSIDVSLALWHVSCFLEAGETPKNCWTDSDCVWDTPSLVEGHQPSGHVTLECNALIKSCKTRTKIQSFATSFLSWNISRLSLTFV